MKTTAIGLIIFSNLLLFLSCRDENGVGPRLNDFQIIGSHNSYKKPIQPELWETIYEKDSLQAMALQYGHIALPCPQNYLSRTSGLHLKETLMKR